MWRPVLGGLLVVVVLPGHAPTIVPPYDCDHDNQTFLRNGNQGTVGLFPWLGVIRVTLNEGAKLRIAVTGAVLVRVTFAIANAEDIAKIPNQILREHTKAMFISSNDSHWLYAISRYDAAPDFRTKTMSSIALVELQLKDDPTPLMPICWQDSNHALSHKHYAVGFNDERYILEKTAYDLKFIPKPQCETYYENLDRNADAKHVPAQYECWAAMNNTGDCEWENGMILVSNYSSTWFLIGIGIRGPGCNLPVRFIPVLPYVGWIEYVIRMKSERMEPSVKEKPAHSFYVNEPEPANDEIQEIDGIPFKKAFNPQRKASKLSPDDKDDGTRLGYDGVASDQGGANQGSRRGASANRRKYEPVKNSTITNAPASVPQHKEPFYYEDKDWKRDDVRHMDPNVLQFKRFFNKYERMKGDCAEAGYLAYKEIVQVTQTSNLVGYAYYKLSLVDLEIYGYTCIVIRVISRSRSDCNLWYSFADTLDEPLARLDDTPGDVLKQYIPTRNAKEGHWQAQKDLEKYFKKERGFFKRNNQWWAGHSMLNLYLKFDYEDNAELVLEVWGGPSGESLKIYTTSPPSAKINKTRTRLKGHIVTRSTRGTRKPRRTRTTTTPKRTRRRRPPPRRPPPRRTQRKRPLRLRTEPPPPADEVYFFRNRMKKATITNMGNWTTKSGNLTTKSGNSTTKSGNLTAKSGNLTTKSGNLTTKSGNLTAKSGNLTTKSGNLTAKSGISTTKSGISTTKSGISTTKSGSNSSDYVESGLCLIVILFISTFG